MTPQQNPISTRLRQARVSLSISPGDIQSRTSIRAHIIEAIDAGRFDELPPVYMRSFLRRYAEQVGISANEIEALIDAHLDTLVNGKTKDQSGAFAALRNAKPKMPAPISLEGSPTRRRVLIFFVSLFGLACLAGVYLLLRGPDEGPLAVERNAALRDVDSLLAPSQPAGRLMNYFGIGDQDSLILEAFCTDTAWVNITADGKISEAVTLEPGQQRRWAGLKGFQLSIRNAGGITLKRNGVELPKVGKLGETVRSIRISRTEFITSASPWRSQRDTTKARVASPQTTPAAKAKPAPSSGVVRPTTTSGAARPTTTTKSLSIPPTKQSIKQPAVKPVTQPARQALQQSGRRPVIAPRAKAANAAAVRIAIEKKLRLQRIQREAKKRELTPVIIR